MWKRQFSTNGDNGYGDDGYGYGSGYDGYESWWWTPAGMAVRYVIVALLFASVLLFFVGGYYHARRRLRKGLPPLRYHRWLVRQHILNSQQQYGRHQNPPNAYQMENYAPPPPAYNHAEMPPPVYQPPQGASKIMADQSYVHVQPLPPVPTQEEGESSGRPPVPRH
ncbi:hypothetical protein LTR78_004372 [Recurvomyces mirabilis]|uniref:Uncharacterized protein n=1 Tax=Recurvomyces mirabilis TaxID=574656 RepID=A0AAE1C2L0_9PEZI|nr:hypothetical protein LTR78_004372 [Recurvomyces mirabilis]KAK5155962.1 hypothetical protein LTS14_005528 [Recurvomyces mirabilis]